MLVIHSSKLLSTHLKVPKDLQLPTDISNVINWHADFFTLNGSFYYILVNDANPDETIALFNRTPLHYSQLAQSAAERIARFYAQTQHKIAFDNFQANSKEIIIIPDTNKQNFTLVDEKLKALKKQLKAQAKVAPTPMQPTSQGSVTPTVDKHARKFYGGLMTHAVHKNTKGR
ncbi:hypothetical protein [Periweissella fabalis]|uniref:Uncharacterized protein n=1 Tax=Periweissella fabalis TaxID=1070421 RepID=A0A7X6N2P1_9LACO|nr:hypothetical protein [Periweissella fabalis]MCM0598529.1 hypothetical protein [Periweissella fabalis]NKZ24189.1 hypothetical protein [Periweissella fabalis]